ncbi:MAG: hypothetical protein H7X71_05745 [Chitinophagales bacterium]|nr:hypothetical protein [Chitinophagales bacterium]
MFSGGIIIGSAITVLLTLQLVSDNDKQIAVQDTQVVATPPVDEGQQTNNITSRDLDTKPVSDITNEQKDLPDTENETINTTRSSSAIDQYQKYTAELSAADQKKESRMVSAGNEKHEEAFEDIESKADIEMQQAGEKMFTQTEAKEKEAFTDAITNDQTNNDETKSAENIIEENNITPEPALTENESGLKQAEAEDETNVSENNQNTDLLQGDPVEQNDSNKNAIAQTESEKIVPAETSEKKVKEKKDNNISAENDLKGGEEKKEKKNKKNEETLNRDNTTGTAESSDSTKFTFLDKLFADKSVKGDSVMGNNEDTVQFMATDTNEIYPNRYAQLSFFTPLGTNGIDSYKYRHNLSFNIIQGYNGAVDGLEFGGVVNIDKGYVNGGQFAGVANVVGGNVKGFQGAGVANLSVGNVKGFQGAGVFNVSRSVEGFQGAGVANVSIEHVKGFQGAGVFNVSVKSVHGIQGAGVMNIITSKDSSTFWQAAGVMNISIAHSKGVQTSGVLNVANEHTGAQIGLLNVSKKIEGFQLGLVNIADTIDGFAVGLLSFSRNGIFDIDLSHNDLFTFNAAVRIGGPGIYNIFTFGTSPLADTITYGYGLGIGGEISFNKFYVDIDALGWNIHRDKFEFNYIDNNFHMNNQLRITPGYKLNKYISFYAGPVLNVEIYDNDIVPLHDNAFGQYVDTNVTTGLSIGYVAGVRFF